MTDDTCFNAALFFVALNQILFFSGVTLTIGLKSTMQFFMKPQNFKVEDVKSLLKFIPSFSKCVLLFTLDFFLFIIQGTISFGVGFFLVVIGWPIIGMMLEAYGFIVLFRYF